MPPGAASPAAIDAPPLRPRRKCRSPFVDIARRAQAAGLAQDLRPPAAIERCDRSGPPHFFCLAQLSSSFCESGWLSHAAHWPIDDCAVASPDVAIGIAAPSARRKSCHFKAALLADHCRHKLSSSPRCRFLSATSAALPMPACFEQSVSCGQPRYADVPTRASPDCARFWIESIIVLPICGGNSRPFRIATLAALALRMMAIAFIVRTIAERNCASSSRSRHLWRSLASASINVVGIARSSAWLRRIPLRCASPNPTSNAARQRVGLEVIDLGAGY